jgi:hypothetical protein
MATPDVARPAALAASFTEQGPAVVDNFQQPVKCRNQTGLTRDALAGDLKCQWHRTEQGDLYCTWNNYETANIWRAKMSTIVTQPKTEPSAESSEWNVSILVVGFAALWFAAAAGEMLICTWLQ